MDRKCIYCGKCKPCPKGIPIPDVIKIMDDISAEAFPYAEAKQKYHDLPAYAGRCVACRQCESRCPYCVPIVKTMRKAGNMFGR